jgi:hypothetical protein
MTEAARQKTERRRKAEQGVRYSFVVLVVMCLLVGVGSFFYTNYRSTHDVGQNNQKFCKLMTALIASPAPPPPPDPARAPAQERQYKNYIIVHNLADDLGCI